MKLFFLIGLFSLIFLSCQKEDKPTVPETQNPKDVEELSEKNQQKTVEVFTITHQADNDEDVVISYENPNNGKKASRFEIEPGQCLKFPSTHFQFIKNIKLGMGFGMTPESGFGDEYKVICGSLLPEDEEAGHRDYPLPQSDSTTLTEAFADVGRGTLCLLELGCSLESRPCSDLGHSSWEVQDVGKFFTDNYVLRKSGTNISEDCQFFEEILEEPS